MTDRDDGLLDTQAATELRAVYTASIPSHLKAEVDRAVQAHMSTPRSRRPRISRSFLRRSPVRVVAAALAAAVIAGGVATELHGSGATAVSAQTLFHRAAAAVPSSGQARHLVYSLTTSDGYSGSADLWVGTTTGGGGADLIALTEAMSRNGMSAPALDLQFVESGGPPQMYDPASNTITSGKSSVVSVDGLRLLMAEFVAPKVENILHLGKAVSQAANHKLTHGTVNGVGVYTITLGDLGTLSFDDQTYTLEELDWSGQSRSWQARLVSQATLPLASVPAGTFALHAPPNARTVQAPDGPKAGQSRPDVVDVISAVAAACRTTPEAINTALSSGTAHSFVQLCQQTRPGVTADELTADTMAQIKSQLDAAVTAGRITRAEADAEYAAVQQKLPRMISGPLGSPGGPKQKIPVTSGQP